MDPTESWFEKYMQVPYLDTIKFKLEATNEELCSGKRCSCMVPLFEEAYSYSINEKPNYGKMVHLLKKELIKIYCVPDKIFSFLQADIKFYGFVILQARESQKIADEEIDENVEVNLIKKYDVDRDNAKFFKDASGKSKNQLEF